MVAPSRLLLLLLAAAAAAARLLHSIGSMCAVRFAGVALDLLCFAMITDAGAGAAAAAGETIVFDDGRCALAGVAVVELVLLAMFVAVSSVSAGGGRVCVKRRSSPADDDHDGGGDDGVCVDSSIVSRHFVDIIYCRGGEGRRRARGLW